MSVRGTPLPALRAALHQNRRLYRDGLVAVLLFVVAELLVCALDSATRRLHEFPAAILAMALVAAVLLLLAQLVDVDAWYTAHVRQPADLINRHMSIGFTVPFTMLINDAITADAVGRIIAGFVTTGLLSTVLVYGVAYAVQAALSAIRLPATTADHAERDSDASSATLRDASDDDQPGDNQSPDDTSNTPTHPWAVLARHPVTVSSLAAIALVGLPVAAATGHDTPLDLSVLVFLWSGTLAAQAAVKDMAALRHRAPRCHRVLVSCLNAVLWCALGMMAYTAAKTAVRRRPLADTLAAFRTDTTLADLLYAAATTHGSTPTLTMGAGDMAASLLDAGIVVWGLKLFECRAQLLSRAGLTVLLVAAVCAVLNLVGAPLLVHAMGLGPASRALAFAARSVTLALAGPAMTSLGGDAGLNAALVVFNGIVFQVAMGLGVGHRTARAMRSVARHWRGWSTEAASDEPVDSDVDRDLDREDARSSQAPTRRGSSHTDEDVRRIAYDVEKAAGRAACLVSLRGGDTDDTDGTAGSIGRAGESPGTVAVGMTVGINAAAMGTAYLYEESSRAAPYAVLSMTLFGVLVVVFAAVQPLADWLAAQMA